MHESDLRKAVKPVSVPAGRVELVGELAVPAQPRGLVVFAHHGVAAIDRAVAATLVADGFATLGFDLSATPPLDAMHLADRIASGIAWAARDPHLGALPIGVFATGAATAAALITAARTPAIQAIVSRSGRPDLACPALEDVRCPTLLVVGGADVETLELNRRAMHQMVAITTLHIVPKSQRDFDEPGASCEVAGITSAWFSRHLASPRWLVERTAHWRH